MAKYRINQPAFIRGEYHEASIQRPRDIELADDVPPNRNFEPLDAAAQRALAKLGVKKDVVKVAAPAPVPAEPKKAEGGTGRPSDQKPT